MHNSLEKTSPVVYSDRFPNVCFLGGRFFAGGGEMGVGDGSGQHNTMSFRIRTEKSKAK